MGVDNEVSQRSRRRFVRTAVYTAPFVLTLRAEPAFASYGSGQPIDTQTEYTANKRYAVLRSYFSRSGGGDSQRKGFIWRLLSLFSKSA